jgi:uncharacterized membrane protein YGL010W
MLGLRAHAIICAALFALLIGIPIVGNLVQTSGTTIAAGAPLLAFQIFYFALFLAFGLSAIPVMVMIVLRVQGAPSLVRHQNAIIWTLWVLIVAGTAVALPTMIHDGFFAHG